MFLRTAYALVCCLFVPPLCSICLSSLVNPLVDLPLSKAGTVTDDDLAVGRIYPKLENIREVSAKVAAEVAREIYSQNLATILPQ